MHICIYTQCVYVSIEKWEKTGNKKVMNRETIIQKASITDHLRGLNTHKTSSRLLLLSNNLRVNKTKSERKIRRRRIRRKKRLSNESNLFNYFLFQFQTSFYLTLFNKFI